MDERDPGDANLAVARRGIELWNSGGIEASKELVWGSNIVMYDVPGAPDARVSRGADAVAARLREVMALIGQLRFELVSLEARGPYVLSVLEQGIEGASGRVTLTVPFFQVGRYEGGRLCELRSFVDAEQARREYERLAGAATES